MMARGFFSGILSGLVVSVIGLGTLSVLTGPGNRVAVPPQPEAGVQGGQDTAQSPSAPQQVAEPEPDRSEAATMPADTDVGEMVEPDTTDDPSVGEAPAAAQAPQVEVAETGDVNAPVDQEAPATPAATAEVTTGQQPVEQPVAPASEVDPAPAMTQPAPVVPSQQAEQTSAPQDGQDVALPTSEETPAAPSLPAQVVGPVEHDPEPTIAEAPEQVGPQPEVETEVEQADVEVAAESAPVEPAAPIKSDPVTTITDRAPGVTTNRLPTIGGDTVQAPAESEVIEVEAIRRNAADFDNPEGRPLMSVLLRDVPGMRADLGDLANLPFAIGFVVDAAQPDAAEAIEFYRAAGAEVVVSVGLPQGATPADADVTLGAQSQVLGKAVGVMMGPDFQTAGDTAQQVAVILGEQGLGLVSAPQGLNTGHKSAVKEGVAAGLVFRELDNDGQSAVVIRRFMDNAAFKARQEKGVIMLGHARAETVQALIEWSLGNRAKSVALAPISAVLLDR